MNSVDTKSKYAKATERCLPISLIKEDDIFLVEGTTDEVMGIKDPFMDERGFSNPACFRLMMEFANNDNMGDYAGETCYYIKYKGQGFVVTDSMFEYI